MSAPVDVRQWLGDERFMYGAGTESRAKCEEVYSAVAELIDALSNLCSGLPHQHADLVAVLGASNAHEVWRLRAALARCGGAA